MAGLLATSSCSASSSSELPARPAPSSADAPQTEGAQTPTSATGDGDAVDVTAVLYGQTVPDPNGGDPFGCYYVLVGGRRVELNLLDTQNLNHTQESALHPNPDGRLAVQDGDTRWRLGFFYDPNMNDEAFHVTVGVSRVRLSGAIFPYLPGDDGSRLPLECGDKGMRVDSVAPV